MYTELQKGLLLFSALLSFDVTVDCLPAPPAPHSTLLPPLHPPPPRNRVVPKKNHCFFLEFLNYN